MGHRGRIWKRCSTRGKGMSAKSLKPGLLRRLLEPLYKWRFARGWQGSCFGVFADFAAANGAAPGNKPLGFDCPEYAAEFQDRLARVFSYDYPILFWLAPLLRENIQIFDLGGHVGMHFYVYSKYLSFPRRLGWTVCDLPEITRRGEDLARQRGASGLSFTNRLEAAESCDILIAAGSLQYIESPSLSVLLSGLTSKPRHLILNKVPLYDGKQFVTLQNGGAAFHPQYIFNRREFVDSLAAIGYQVKDTWNVEARPGRIPLHPERSFPYHSGLYLVLDDSPKEEIIPT